MTHKLGYLNYKNLCAKQYVDFDQNKNITGFLLYLIIIIIYL